jgi:hypothetical protein
MRWTRHVARWVKGAYRALEGKPYGKGSLGRPGRRWEDNIKMALQEIECGRDVDWIDLAQGRVRCRAVVNTVMNLRVTENAKNFLTGLPRRTVLHAVSQLVVWLVII